jgi:hypothetical protein
MDPFDFIAGGPQDLRPGDIGFSTIPGQLGGAVSLGQALLRDECRFTHAFLVTRDHEQPADTGRALVEAMPRGARYLNQNELVTRFGPGYGYIRLPLTADQQDAISDAALALVGTPYSFLDYAALALWERSWTRPLGGNALRRYVSSSERMICSQLIDHVLCEVGFHLFTDGRLHQDVTPGQLWWQAGAVGRAFWWPECGPARSTTPAAEGWPRFDAPVDGGLSKGE